MNKIMAVTGITGHSGNFFLQELIKNQYPETIRCLVRDTSDTRALEESGLKIEKVVGSISDEETVRKLLHNVDSVMHITNIHYSVSMLRIAMEEGVRRAVFIHTTGIYSKFKTAADDYKRIEDEIQNLLQKKSIDLTILRPTMIFGDLCDHNISKFIHMMDKLPIMPEIDRGKCCIRPVNARDLGKAYYQVINKSELPELSYDITGSEPITMHDLFGKISMLLKKKRVYISIPMPIGLLGAKVLSLISFRKIDITEKVLRMGENRDYSHETASRDFGYFAEPFDIGLKREVEQYMKKGD